MVWSGTSAASFKAASQDLAKLSDHSISAERVRRACGHVGADRLAQRQRLQRSFESKSLPDQNRGKPSDVAPPKIACVMADGGRYQQLDRNLESPRPTSARKGEHWKESRIGILVRMIGEQYENDPQPVLPPELRYDAMAETLAEIGKTGAKLESCDEPDESEATSSIADNDGLVGPQLERRKVVASRQPWDEFGPLLASQAWYQGFAAAERKVFVSDGSATIEKMQRTHFRHYTSVLDILHALSYCLAAARAISKDEGAARHQYNDWASAIWEGRVDDVINILIAYEAKYGPPPENSGSDDPREILRVSRTYYENHADRMDYPTYRTQGYPLTSSLMESSVKQVSRRVKGTEKYWASPGAEAILTLRADYLSDDEPMEQYWQQRASQAKGTRAYGKSKSAVYA
jgi:hypothetical protein